MYEYYSTGGRSKRIPAEINRKIIEVELINAFHWLPQDIAGIPYKKIQDLLLILEIKEENRTARANTENAKQNARQMASGGKSYREV